MNHSDNSLYLGKIGKEDIKLPREKRSEGHTGPSVKSILIFLGEHEIWPVRDIEILCHRNSTWSFFNREMA